jgi:hypothetical protein
MTAPTNWSPLTAYPAHNPRVTVRTASGDEYAEAWKLADGQWVIPCGASGQFGIETPYMFRTMTPRVEPVSLPRQVWRFAGLFLAMLAGGLVAGVLALAYGVPALWREAGEE